MPFLTWARALFTPNKQIVPELHSRRCTEVIKECTPEHRFKGSISSSYYPAHDSWLDIFPWRFLRKLFQEISAE